MSLFPFAAVVGQEDVKEAIILNLILLLACITKNGEQKALR